MAGDHARLPPSSADKWMRCPGQPRLAATAPEGRPSLFAAEGTFYHEVAAMVLRDPGGDHRAIRWLGHTDVVDGFSFKATEENLAHVQTYVDACLAEVEPGDDWAVETRVGLNGDLWGTADFVRYRPSTGHLFINDLKFGTGVRVEAEGNRQLLTYAAMCDVAMAEGKSSSMTLAITQPRIDAEAGPVRRADIDALDLFEFRLELDAAVEACRDPDAPLVPGGHCKWCPAAGFCPALQDYAMEQARITFSTSKPFTPESLSEALDAVAAVKEWITAVEHLAYEEANRGRPPPGWKLVNKRSVRQWIEAESVGPALELLGYDPDTFAPRKLMTPKQVEGVVADEDRGTVQSMYVRRSSGTVLVPETDKRSAVTPEAFTVVDPEQERKD